jgi:MraZ protein
MFRGATKVTLDEKGRMVMPNRYRDALVEQCQGKLIVTVDIAKCLAIYPLPAWEQTENKLMSLPSLNETARMLQRLMVGYATDLELDGHGRILLPPELRGWAQLTRLGMLIGQGNRFELWDEAKWNEQSEAWLGKEGGAAGDLPSLLQTLSL